MLTSARWKLPLKPQTLPDKGARGHIIVAQLEGCAGRHTRQPLPQESPKQTSELQFTEAPRILDGSGCRVVLDGTLGSQATPAASGLAYEQEAAPSSEATALPAEPPRLKS